MSTLWASDDISTWQDSLAQVGKRLQALENPKLVELERHVTVYLMSQDSNVSDL